MQSMLQTMWPVRGAEPRRGDATCDGAGVLSTEWDQTDEGSGRRSRDG